jgi:hypothetical protein
MASWRKLAVPVGLATTTATCTALAYDVQVIFSEAPGHPTAVVPGALGLDGRPLVTEFKAMEILAVNPEGTYWIVKGRNHGGGDVETMMLSGSLDTGSVFAQEGQPVPGGAEGEVFDFFGSGGADFGTGDRFAFTGRARGGDASIAQKGFSCEGAGGGGVVCTLVREQGDAALGLVDQPPNPSGDELFGNSVGSFHLLNDGTVGSQDSTIQNIHSSRRPAIFYGDTAFLQSGVSAIAGSTWDSFDLNGFSTTSDGTIFLVRGDDEGPDSQDDILVHGSASLGGGDGLGAVVLREGTEIGETGITVDGIFNARLADDGTWFARGDDPLDDDWVVRNGEIIARTGAPVVPGDEELWAAAIVAVNGNSNGGWVVSGGTDASNPAANSVLVRGGDVTPFVVLREGDAIDLDGNGMLDDDAFIGRSNPDLSPFHADDLYLGDNDEIYVFVSLVNKQGEDLGEFGTGGDAFLRIVPDPGCPGDVDGGGEVGVDDLVAVILDWGPCPPGPCPADLDDDGTVGVTDLTIVILNWGACP